MLQNNKEAMGIIFRRGRRALKNKFEWFCSGSTEKTLLVISKERIKCGYKNHSLFGGDIMAKDYNKLKMENDRIKKTLYDKSLEMNKLKAAIKSFENKEKEYEKKIHELQNEIKRYEEENSPEIYKREIGALRHKLNEYKAKTVRLEEKLNQAKKKNDKYTFDDVTQHIKGQNKHINNLRMEIEGNKNTIMQLKNILSMYETDVRKMTIASLLNELWSRMRYRNLRYFDWKFDRLMRSVIKFRQNIKNANRIEDSGEIAITEESCTFGYIIEWDFELIFIDANGNKYELSVFPHNIRDIIEIPVKAYIREGKALIIDTYDYTDEQTAESGKVLDKTKGTTQSLEQEMQPFEKPFKVLIVGSSGKSKYYRSTLQSLGLEVLTYDSFEESPQRLKDQYEKADIVIVCTSHIRHFVIGIIDVHENKVTQIEKDSEVTIYARTRFMAIQLGLL